jgi:hypothetical protein
MTQLSVTARVFGKLRKGELQKLSSGKQVSSTNARNLKRIDLKLKSEHVMNISSEVNRLITTT